MAYGTIKVDTITFTDGGVDKSVAISGLVQNPTFTGNVTATGTISGDILRGQTISGVIITGTTAQFTSGTFVSLTGTTLQGTTATYTTGSFTSLTGTTTSGTTANFVSGVFSTQISGVTVTGTTANFTSGNFTNISGGTHTITSGVFAAGTAANPSISFTSDPNTGIYSPGADQVAISSSGTQRVNFGTGEVVFNETGENYDFRIEGDTEPNLVFVDASTNRVGLGTSVPGTRFDIASNFSYGTASSNVIRLGASYSGGTSTSPSSLGAITWGSNDTYSEHGRINVATINPSTSNNSRMEFWINSSGISQAMTLTPTGLGIGTGASTPGGTLEVKAAASVAPFVASGPSSEYARIDSSGRLLVGTSSDSGGALLQVNGDRVRIATAKTPASASDTGTTGEICWDANYIYVCTATNTWKRSAISTW